MKKISKKTILLVLSVVLILSVSFGTTLAYFSDYKEAKGEAPLALKGSTDITEKIVDNNKNITIKNTGDTVVVVRVGVFGPDGMEVSGDNWTPYNGFYYYDLALKPGETADTLVASIEGTEEDLGEDLEIIVVHESETAKYVNGTLAPQSQWFVKTESGEGE